MKKLATPLNFSEPHKYFTRSKVTKDELSKELIQPSAWSATFSQTGTITPKPSAPLEQPKRRLSANFSKFSLLGQPKSNFAGTEPNPSDISFKLPETKTSTPAQPILDNPVKPTEELLRFKLPHESSGTIPRNSSETEDESV